MFDNIARNYDFLNHFLSAGIDISWRRKLIRELKKHQPEKIIDIATGTADLSIMAAQNGINDIVGIDISVEMLKVGNEKVKRNKLEGKIRLLEGDAEKLDFDEGNFDAAMVSFGVRNFENLEKGLVEIKRVLKIGKPLMILEFSKPTVFPVKQFYHFYSFVILPTVGKIFSGNSSAYKYLPDSIIEFPSGNKFLDILETCGYKSSRKIPLTFGIATLYIAIK